MIGEHPLSNKDYSSMINPRHYQRIMELMKYEKIVEGGYGDIRLRKIAPNDTCECKRRIHGDAGRDFWSITSYNDI